MFMMRQRRSQWMPLLGLCCLLWTGCGGSTTKPAGSGGGSGAGVTPPKATKVSLKPVNKTELDKFIASQKGKVLLIDVWASW